MAAAFPRSLANAAIAIGLACSAWGAYEILAFSRLKSGGRVATAQSVETLDSRRARGNAVTYTAQVFFVAESGARVSGTRDFGEELAEDVRAGRPVRVRYDADKPERFILEKEGRPWGWLGAGAILVIVGLVRRP